MLGLLASFVLHGCTGRRSVPLAVDQDQDGFGADVDCDDQDPAVFPGAEDVWYDGVDSDCDGADDFDRDGDGDASALFGGGDCDDTDPSAVAIAGWEDGDICRCGNGIREPGEACDGPNTQHWTCDSDCSGPCGDGLPNDEQCVVELPVPDFLWRYPVRGDFDGDGRDDIIASPDYEDSVLWLGLGDGTFSETGSIPVGNLHQENAGVGDLDGDGRDDLLYRPSILGSDVLEAAVYSWDGATFSFVPIDVPMTSIPTVADLDGDGDADLLASTATGFEVLLNDGTLAFPSGGHFDVIGDRAIVFPVVEDWDGDGREEVFVAVQNPCCFDSGRGGIAGFDTGQLSLTMLVDPGYAVGSLDIDGDGCLDLLLSDDTYHPCHSVFEAPLPVPGFVPESIRGSADLDGDGVLEVLTYAVENSGFTAAWRRGSEGYEAVDLGRTVEGVPYAIDVDGDGRDEVLFESYQSFTPMYELLRWDP